MEKLCVELRIDDGGLRINISPNRPHEAIIEGAKWLSFELCRKKTPLGPVEVDQFWMPIRSVYEQRQRTARNYAVIVECFWALCLKHATIFSEEVQDSFILAKLLPWTRSNGSRRIFADAVLTSPDRLGTSRRQIIAGLDDALARNTHCEIDIVAFRDAVARILGPRPVDEPVQRRYQEIAGELLGAGRTALQNWGTPGLSAPLQKWRSWMTAVGRRGGNSLDKQVLDILSYECRAALHRCYSAAWCELLPYLAARYELSAESIVFHRFWHLEPCQPQGTRDSLFHLFHGHIFALHPAAALFSLTNSGAKLLGDWLLEPEPGPAYRRLLSGLLLAIAAYSNWIEFAATERKAASRFITGVDIEDEHAAKTTQSRRRRRSKFDA